jgi:selenophosphate synthetase-related protein
VNKYVKTRMLHSRIESHGFSVKYVEYCEDASTPGLLGQIRGVTNRERREVKISLKSNPRVEDLHEILEHELRHIEEPDWDCGNRDVIGRGGP